MGKKIHDNSKIDKTREAKPTWLRRHNLPDEKYEKNNKYNRFLLNKYWNWLVKIEKAKMSERGGRGGRIGRTGSGRVRGSQRNFNISKNLNKRQELKFHSHGTGPNL